jgi:hypothetical protein
VTRSIASRQADPERVVLASVIEALAALGCRPRRRNMRHDPVSDKDGVARHNAKGRLVYARSEEAGEADVTATIPGLGTRLEVEVKRPGKVPTPRQYARIAEVNAVGGIAVWVDDIAWLIWAVDHFKKGAKARTDSRGESAVYYPDSGTAGRVAFIMELSREEYRAVVSQDRS